MNNFSTSGTTLRMPLALLLVSSLVTGVALTANDASTARVDTPAIGAWLGTDDTGVVSHVGPAGVDASIEIRPPVGQLRVHVVDGQVVLSDDGGNVTRLDDAALAVAQEEQLPVSARLAGGGDRLYTIDADDNSVQELDPTELGPIGEAVMFETGPGGIGLGDAVVDDEGTLWVADGADGSVLEILGSEVIDRHEISAPGVRLDLALTDAGALAVDPSARTIQLINAGSVHALPFTTEMSAPDRVDGSAILPVVADGQVALIDPGTGSINVVDLGTGANELGLPVVAGNRVLIPDLTDGVLHVIELDTAAVADDIALPEQTSDFEMISDGSVAYVNDRTSTNVWIIAPDGDIERDDKFDPESVEDGATPPGESEDPGDAEIELAPPPATPPSANPTPRPPQRTPATTAPPITPPSAGPTNPSTTEPSTNDTSVPNTDPSTETSVTGNGAVTIDSVTAGVGRATVTWTAPVGWLGVDRYLVRVLDDTDQVVQEQPFSADITQFEARGLTNGVDHRFEITASSGQTLGVAVLSTAVRPDVLGDGAVVALTATAADSSVTASWSEPTGWYDIAEYVVVVTGPGGDVDVEQVDSDVFAYTTTSVTNGTTYNVTVNAVGVGGQAGPDVTSNPVTPISVVPTGDGAVEITSISADDTTANATWLVPTDWFTVTGYDVIVLNDDDTEHTTASVNISGTSVAIGALVNGRTYRLRVTATSAQGPAAPTVSDPVTPYGSGAVTNLVAIAGDGQVQASWTPPTAWHPVSSYTVEVSPGGISGSVAAAATSFTQSGLTNGQEYTVRVTANRTVGASGDAVTSDPFTPAADVPSAPLGVSVLIGTGTILLDWSAPATGTVGSFRIDAVPTDGSTGATQTVAGSRTSVELRNLTNGLPYDVFIYAVHPGGALGAPATVNNVSPGGPPDSPAVTSTPTSSGDGTSVTLRWSAPNGNGSALSDYLINGQQVGGAVVASDVVVAPSATSFTVTGLQPSTQYSFTIAARNGIGQGAPSTFATVTTATPALPAPNQPRNMQGVGAQNHVDLTWAAPTANGATVGGYQLSLAGTAITLPSSARSHQWTGLANSTSYTFVLRAVGADGQLSNPTAFTASTTAPPTTTTPPQPAPSVPTGVTATALGQTSIRVSWSQPNPANTSSWIIGYNSGRATSSATSIDISGLQPGTTHQILVWSLGPTGLQSGSSTPINVTTASPPPIPAAVTGLNAFLEWRLFDANWVPVAGATGYRISVNGGAVVDVGSRTNYFLNNFGADSGTVTVWAYNSSGTGPPASTTFTDMCPGPIAC